jgi:hypothetical protein
MPTLKPQVRAIHCLYGRDALSQEPVWAGAARAYYLEHKQELVDRYAGEFILLQDGEVIWHDTTSRLGVSRGELARGKRRCAMWLKYVDPEEAEGEHYEVYERALAHIRDSGL